MRVHYISEIYLSFFFYFQVLLDENLSDYSSAFQLDLLKMQHFKLND
jgi:hypothetical protein